MQSTIKYQEYKLYKVSVTFHLNVKDFITI